MSKTLQEPHEIATAAAELSAWIAYADRLENILEVVCGQSKDKLKKLHAEQGLKLVRPIQQTPGA